MGPQRWIERHQLAVFWITTFGLTWASWIPAARQGTQALTTGPLGIVGVFVPSVVALILTALTAGTDGLRDLLRQLLRWRVAPRWYLFVLGMPALMALAGIALGQMLHAPAPDWRSTPVHMLLPAGAAAVSPWVLLAPLFVQQVLFSSPLGEEIGWRGYALVRLQQRYRPLSASLLLGILWGLWHLPRLWAASPGASGLPFLTSVVGAVLGTVATAILFTWVFNGTGGSLLLVLLLHAAYNTTGLFLPAAPDGAGLVVAWLVALAVVVRAGSAPSGHSWHHGGSTER